jgi:3'-5' exoribonuclease
MKNHHAWEHGLAEHVLSMLELAHNAALHYQGRYGSGAVDVDLLLAGVFLHDLGKVYDYERRGLAWELTTRGVAVGHIATCTELLALSYEACETPHAVRERLTHLVLSHHGIKSFGSPVEPVTVEARILHQVDMLDSRISPMMEVRDELDDGEMSEWVRAIRGRVLR